MKKIGNVQIISLQFRPTVYTFDEITHKLIFNRVLSSAELQLAVGEIGKEISTIRNIRKIAAQGRHPEALRELSMVEALVADLSYMYNNINEFLPCVNNGSGKMVRNYTTLTFVKPRVVEFENAKN